MDNHLGVLIKVMYGHLRLFHHLYQYTFNVSLNYALRVITHHVTRTMYGPQGGVRTINCDITNLQGQAIRRTIIPQNIVNIKLIFNSVIFSFRNNTPKPTANKTEVSRRDETTATGVVKQAHNTAT